MFLCSAYAVQASRKRISHWWTTVQVLQKEIIQVLSIQLKLRKKKQFQYCLCTSGSKEQVLVDHSTSFDFVHQGRVKRSIAQMLPYVHQGQAKNNIAQGLLMYTRVQNCPCWTPRQSPLGAPMASAHSIRCVYVYICYVYIYIYIYIYIQRERERQIDRQIDRQIYKERERYIYIYIYIYTYAYIYIYINEISNNTINIITNNNNNNASNNNNNTTNNDPGSTWSCGSRCPGPSTCPPAPCPCQPGSEHLCMSVCVCMCTYVCMYLLNYIYIYIYTYYR